MDRFSKVITTNEMSIKDELPLPNRPKYSRLDISFDKFNEFINRYLSGGIRLHYYKLLSMMKMLLHHKKILI